MSPRTVVSGGRLVTRLYHLSDLHMTHAGTSQDLLLDRLVAALHEENRAHAHEQVAVAITGDVFYSATEGASLVRAFMALHERIRGALGPDTPTIVLPGNHDRRRLGFVGPHREDVFLALSREAHGRVFVAGTETPFLAQVVPPELHGLPLHVIAYDSSYLPRGIVGAGGTFRLEDLLHAHAKLPADDKAILVLVHHHLVPTPVTDVSGVERERAPRIARWLLGTAAPVLVSHSDHEELTMTALGAGTALSTLHTLGRPVVLLHGHKHVPTARLLKGMTNGSSDLLLASAGTAGLRERVHATRDADGARLWPTFNVVDIDGDRVSIEQVSFSPKRDKRPPVHRVLARVHRSGRRWEREDIASTALGSARVKVDSSRCYLLPSSASSERWELACERSVELAPGTTLRRYVDFVRSLPRKGRRGVHRGVHRVDLALDGTVRHVVRDAAARTLKEGERSYGIGTAFEYVELLCRYGAARARLRLEPKLPDAFASVTDLSTGRERPLPIAVDGDGWLTTADDCAPRTLLRIYWPLERQ